MRSDWKVVVLADRALANELSELVKDPNAVHPEKHYADSSRLWMGIT